MKLALLLCTLIGSVALGSGSFDGIWSGSGLLLTAQGQQNCTFDIQIDQPASDISFNYISMRCSLVSNMSTYYYKSSGNKIYDVVGHEIGEISSGKIHISPVWADGSVHEINLKLDSGKVQFYETLISRAPASYASYSTVATLTKRSNQ